MLVCSWKKNFWKFINSFPSPRKLLTRMENAFPYTCPQSLALPNFTSYFSYHRQTQMDFNQLIPKSLFVKTHYSCQSREPCFYMSIYEGRDCFLEYIKIWFITQKTGTKSLFLDQLNVWDSCSCIVIAGDLVPSEGQSWNYNFACFTSTWAQSYLHIQSPPKAVPPESRILKNLKICGSPTEVLSLPV